MRNLNSARPSIWLLCFLALSPLTPSSANETDGDRAPAPVRHEVQDDPYVPSPRQDHPRSPATRIATGSFFAVQVNVDELGQNIIGDAANEPSIAIDPTDPDRMTIAWRQFDTISSNFRQAGYGYTTDGGLSWTFPGVIEPGVFRSDPVLDSDSEGKIYYNSLTIEAGDYLCDVFRSTEGGMTWDSGTDARGGDKQWMVIDKSGGVGEGHIYADWTSFFSSCPPGFFTRSTDGGDFFESCTQIPNSPYWGTLAVAPSGTLYAVGSNGNDFVVARSSNAQMAGQPVTWNSSTVVSLGGSIEYGAGPNPDGLAGQVWIATAPGPGPGGTEVYVLCSVNPPGDDPLDVRFARSTNGGLTWSSSVRVNDDAGNGYQWFGTMSVSPSGRIDAVWLDTRDNPGTYLSSLYYSYSTDGGVTWSGNERLSDSFDPHVGWPQQNKMGDYFHMISDDAGFSLAWAATLNGEQDVYYGRKTLPTTAVAEGTALRGGPLWSDPNPFRQSTTIRYMVPVDGLVTLKVYDLIGREVASLASGERQAGTYEAQIDGRALAAGVYFCRLTAGEFQVTGKLQRLR
jgi:hypothetical protein